MENKKQTAVEWLENQIKTSKYSYKLMEDINSRSTVAQSDIFEQAKEMEKEQIINAHTRAYLIGECDISKQDGDIVSTKYYNQTFKKD
jgi:aminoglycoside N3'-acetyltransferase